MLKYLRPPARLRSIAPLYRKHPQQRNIMSSINGNTSWQEIVRKKREEAYSKIPKAWRLPASYTDRVGEDSNWNVLGVPRECGILSALEIDITENYDAVALLAAMKSGKYTAEQVTTAFCKRAAIAQQLTRCITETFFDEAIARARVLDQDFQFSGQLKGPFHGLPISLKDSFNIKGIETTVGYVSFVGHCTASQNAILADQLLKLGAVLYVKTNIPQTQMSADSENNLFGRVLNPNNLSWGAGGSSGGEGALVAMRGSIMGVGTDIAGSVRIPALSCGTFGFRPSVGRIPYPDQGSGDRSGYPGPPPVSGPLATSARDLKFFMQTVVGAEPWREDPFSYAVPWKHVSKSGPLKLGWVEDGDPKYPLHPPVVRALKSAVQKLRQAGHEIVTLKDVPSISKAAITAFKYFTLDPNDTAMQHIKASGEPVISSLKTSNMTFPDEQFGIGDLFTLNGEKEKFIAEWHQIWRENKLDAVIMPGHRKTAGPHDSYGHPPYTLIWNLADCPACIIPYEKADASKDGTDKNLADYDPAVVDGAPCAVQLVGQKFCDEALVAVAETVASVLADGSPVKSR